MFMETTRLPGTHWNIHSSVRRSVVAAASLGLAGVVSYFAILNSAESESPFSPLPAHLLPQKTPESEGQTISPVSSAAGSRNETQAEQLLRQKVELLQQGRAGLESIPAYTATWVKQELVSGELLDEQVVFLKFRRQPFSVYLHWLTSLKGREVIYVEGTNNGNLIAHEGGWKSRIPALTLNPHGSLAMADTRYPVTSAGFQGLIDLMVAAHEAELSNGCVASCEVSDVEVDGRPCRQFTSCCTNPQDSPIYRKAVTCIDRERNLPVKTQHYGWPSRRSELSDNELDAATLIESYQFTEIDFQPNLSDADFDRANEEYRFH